MGIPELFLPCKIGDKWDIPWSMVNRVLRSPLWVERTLMDSAPEMCEPVHAERRKLTSSPAHVLSTPMAASAGRLCIETSRACRPRRCRECINLAAQQMVCQAGADPVPRRRAGVFKARCLPLPADRGGHLWRLCCALHLYRSFIRPVMILRRPAPAKAIGSARSSSSFRRKSRGISAQLHTPRGCPDQKCPAHFCSGFQHCLRHSWAVR